MLGGYLELHKPLMGIRVVLGGYLVHPTFKVLISWVLRVVKVMMRWLVALILLSHHLCTQISVVQYKAGSMILFFWIDSIPVSPGMFKSRYLPNTGCLFFPTSTSSISASTLQASSR